jgi:5'-nucleotidase
LAQAVFFDLDETLLRHTLDGPELVARVHSAYPEAFDGVDARQFGLALWEKGQALWGAAMFEPTEPGDQALLGMFRDTLEALDLDPVHARPLRDAFVRLVLEGTAPYPGAVDTLNTLRGAGIVTGIITNGYCHLQDAKIARHGLAGLVDFVLVSEAAGAHKPDPRIFQLALDRAGAAPSDAWHVGDHLVNDIAGAENAGLTSVLFDPHGDRLPPDESALPEGGRMPNYIVSALHDVPDLIRTNGLK